MAIFPSSAIPSAAADYTVDNSVRFNSGDSPYLARTPGSAGSARTFTISFWVKRSKTGSDNTFFEGWKTPMSDANSLQAAFNSSDEFSMQTDSAATILTTNQLFRDFSAWYHFCIAFDTTQGVAADRIKLYVNGSQVTSFRQETYPAEDFDYVGIKEGEFTIGSGHNGTSYHNFQGGYFAEWYFIDGTQYAASDFGETNSTTNQWIPKDASGLTFGTNGFYQKYGSTEANTISDSSSTSWTAPEGITSVDYLVVGGGGGGGSSVTGATATGYNAGGGGGAGGMLTGTLTVVPGTAYTITVGDGGTAGSASSGGDGDNSVFASITSTGGGGGGRGGSAGRSGGSGGGGGSNTSGASGTAGQGNSGGTSPNWGAGGGGGKSAAGQDGDDPTNSHGGDGGAGTASSISGSSVTYAGGGGGGGTAGDNNSDGGAGGGGTGGSYNHTDATAGTANTGGGGGGAGGVDASTALNGAAGGSGIVVLDDGTTVTSFTSSHSAHTITANGNVTQARAVKKVGDSSIKFDGSGDYLTVPSSSDWDFWNSDFTMECWVRFNNISANQVIWYQGGGSAPELRVDFEFGDGDGPNMYQRNTSSPVGFAQGSNTGWSADTWYHFALVRNGSSYVMYRDGTSVATLTDATTIMESIDNVGVIGTMYSGGTYSGSPFNGYIDEYRISNTARYTTSFTPSTTAFTADANTLLLIHSNWTGGFGADSSGNYNNFTPTNLVATDQMLDTPTNNWCTLNPIFPMGGDSPTISEGNLKVVTEVGTLTTVLGTMATGATGKWYAEFLVLDSQQRQGVGATSDPTATDDQDNNIGNLSDSRDFGYTGQNGYFVINTVEDTSYGDAFSNGDIIAIAINLDDNEVNFYRNNVAQGVKTIIASSAGYVIGVTNISTGYNMTMAANYGQDSSFAGEKTAQGNQDANERGDFYYAPPTGFLAVCTSNLPDPEIALPGDNFNTVLYTGDDSSNRAITGVGFAPDLVWVKDRDATYWHQLHDSVRGIAGGPLYSNANNVEDPTYKFDSFDSDGFTTGSEDNAINTASDSIVVWNWKAGGAPTVDNSAGVGATPTAGSVKIDGSNLGSALAGSIAATRISASTTAGFSIVNFTNNNTAGATIAHGLSQAPEVLITKITDSAYSWYVYHIGMDAAAPEDYVMYLDNDSARSNTDETWNDTKPTASVFTLGDEGSNALGSRDVIAYCFHSVEGYSKMGRYVGNGNADGPFIYTGFRPAYIMIKVAPSWSGGHWHLFDTKRYTYNETTNTTTTGLVADDTGNDGGGGGEGAGPIDILSNGFKIRNSNGNDNANGDNVTYTAFAESPFKTSNAR